MIIRRMSNFGLQMQYVSSRPPDDTLAKILVACILCCVLLCCIGSSATVYRNCTGGTYDSYDYDSDMCFSLGPSPSLSPASSSASGETDEEKFPSDISGLSGRYTVGSVKSGKWEDLSGKDNHAEVVGTLTSYKEGDIDLVRGDSSVVVKFPAACLNATNKDYTLAYVGKYAGEKRGRIFEGVGLNWLSGWHGNRSGYAYHGAGEWLTVYTTDDNKHGQALMMGVDQKNLFRSNGTNRTKIGYTNGEAPTSFAINGGLAKESNWDEVSDFALGEVLIYDRELSDVEIGRVEKYLQAKFFKDISNPAEFVAKGWRQGDPGAKNGEAFEPIKAIYEISGTQEHCRMLAEKYNKVVWGHRNESHTAPEWRNTCFFYDTNENFDGYVDDTSDTVHTMGCADATKDVHKGCQ